MNAVLAAFIEALMVQLPVLWTTFCGFQNGHCKICMDSELRLWHVPCGLHGTYDDFRVLLHACTHMNIYLPSWLARHKIGVEVCYSGASNKGHFGASHVVLCREVVLLLEVQNVSVL